MCERCGNRKLSIGEQPVDLTDAQKKQLIERQIQIQKVNQALVKEVSPYLDNYKKLLKDMKKCDRCKETEFTFDVCDRHYAELEKINQRIVRIKTAFAVKRDINIKEAE